MDEYELEINSLRRTLDRLRADEADQPVIDEYEAELRILRALYDAALRTMARGRRATRGCSARWSGSGSAPGTSTSVYSFVYEAAMDAEPAVVTCPG